MKLAIVALSAAIGAAAAPAAAQDLGIKEPSIIVVGVGEVEAAPDLFRIQATAQGQGADQVAALRALAANQDRMTDGLNRLEGLTHRSASHSSVSVTPTFAGECEEARYGGPGAGAGCPISGYTATSSLVFEGSPVDLAGNAVSLASQLGARNAALMDMRIADDSTARTEASRAAFVDARRQADLLAAASGQRIVRVLRMQQADDRMMYAMDAAAPAAPAAEAVAMELIAPEVALNVAVEPQTVSSRLVVAFEIE